MQELRFVAVSEDGSYAVLAIPGRSGRYILPIDERLRAVALGQTSRLAQYEIEVESPLRPKEIQARIRAGETAEEIADAAGIPVERVRWFEGPVLAERAYIADQAQSGSVRRAGDSSGPGPRLGDIVTERLSAAGTDPADGQWDSRKRGDGHWQVSLTFPSGGRLHVAEWVFDPRRRHVMPDDDNAARLSLPESELPAEPAPVPGEATVTPIASRLGAAAGMGGGSISGFPGASRFRPDKSVIPDRSLGVDRSLVDRPAAMPDRAAAGLSDRVSAPSSPVPPRPGQQDRAPQAGRPAHPGYSEFPESAPYRAPEPAPRATPSPEAPAYHDPRGGYGDPASLSGASRAPAAEPPAYREPTPSAYHTAAEPTAYHGAAPEPRPYRDPAGVRASSAEPPAYREPAAYQAPEPTAYRAPAPQPEPRDPRPEPAAHRAPATDTAPVPAFDDPERVRLTPPRPVIFEDPEPAFLGKQLELAPEFAPAPPVPVAPAGVPQPAATAPAAAPAPASPAPTQVPATAPAEIREPKPTVAVSTEPVAASIVAEPQATATTDQVALATESPATGAAATETARPAEAALSAEASAPSEPVAVAEPAVTAQPTARAADDATARVVEPATATSEPEAAEPRAEVASPAEPEPAEESPARRPGAKKNAKARRSSVPSWDEIMLGSARQRD